MDDFFTREAVNKRQYTEKEKSVMYLKHIDDERYASAVNKYQINLSIATLQDQNNITIKALTFSSLPTTISQLAQGTSTTPIIRSLNSRDSKFDNNRGAQKRGRYDPTQCLGCKQLGHKIQGCNFIPKVTSAIEYIKKNQRKTEALVKEYTRVNDRNTKRGTIRLLQQSGTLDSSVDSDQILQEQDIDVEMMDVDLHDIVEEEI